MSDKKPQVDAHYGRVIANAGKGKGVKKTPMFKGKASPDPHAGLRKYAISQKTLKKV